MSSRVDNSLRNVKFAMIFQVVILVLGFVTRWVFIAILGEEYLGFTVAFGSIFAVLSLAEAGMGAALVFHMYDPIARGDEQKIATLVHIFKKAYTYIAIIVLVIGIGLTPFLRLLITDIPDHPNLHLIYILFIIHSVMAYMFAHQQALITANQKEYVISQYRMIFNIVLNVLKIAFLIITRNFIVFLLIQITMAFATNSFIGKIGQQMYPFLKTVKPKKLEPDEKTALITSFKAMLMHKFGTVFVLQTDGFIMAALIGWHITSLYANYILIVASVQTFVDSVFRAILASVGNVGATQNNDNLEEYFKKVNFCGFWLATVTSICVFFLTNPFITLIFDETLLLPTYVVAVIALNFFLLSMRRSVLTFRDALGIFDKDRFKPIFEAIVNISATIFLGIHFGIAGVLLGTTVNTIFVCMTVEPYVVYKFGLKKPLKNYYFILLQHVGVAGLIVAALYFTVGIFASGGLVNFLILSVFVFVIINVILLIIYWRSSEFKYFYNILLRRLKRN